MWWLALETIILKTNGLKSFSQNPQSTARKIVLKLRCGGVVVFSLRTHTHTRRTCYTIVYYTDGSSRVQTHVITYARTHT
jgi:hypothetical protein